MDVVTGGGRSWAGATDANMHIDNTYVWATGAGAAGAGARAGAGAGILYIIITNTHRDARTHRIHNREREKLEYHEIKIEILPEKIGPRFGQHRPGTAYGTAPPAAY